MAFQEIPNRYEGPVLEKQILEFWKSENIFAQSLQHSAGKPLFTFNEGPPTANGKPGLHHVLARTFKDIYPRYKTMRGYHAPRRAGWDTHGLPVEHEIEKELGIFDKKRIETEIGVAEFTRRCRESVMRYIGEWERMTERMGFWVDMGDAYYTLDNKYIESVWHLLKTIWDKGLINRAHKVVPYDPRIGATLSSHEVAQGYKEVSDPSIHVRFPLAGEENTAFLVWTTTPWTLPSNAALAVNPEVTYARVALNGEVLILAQDLVATVLESDTAQVLESIPGRELLGLRYRRVFDYLPAMGMEEGPSGPRAVTEGRVLAGSFVTTEEGTGIVHMAPAYGADDLETCRNAGLAVVHGVGLDGCFLPQVTPVAGLFFKDADPVLMAELKEKGLLFRSGKILHNYPFGWRTGDPLIYYAKEAWYIRTTQVKDRMVALNNTVNWVPETIREGRFGNWLENNVDWALSRERFWGTPLPVWSDGEGTYECLGSLSELEARTGRSLSDLDLHRPAVDEITYPHPETGKRMRRVPEVIDCWFDSGAMSYAQWHYPFENRESFQKHFPADYICEGIDQTRGWFYTLHAIAALVSDSVAFRNVICLSHLVDKNGKKMSKSIGNVLNPDQFFNGTGVDALRWFFLVRVAPDGQKRISLEIISDVAATFLNTFWNTYAFFLTYARLDAVSLDDSVPLAERPEMDHWILALLEETVAVSTRSLDGYDAKSAGEAIESFVDQLSNWYVRRNRRRFWKGGQGQDKAAAHQTLYTCLVTVNRLMAPFMPFLTEAVHQNLVRRAPGAAPPSVHLEPWPEARPEWANADLLAQVAVVQKVVNLGRAGRAASGHRVRQPLERLLARVPDDAAQRAVESHAEQILEELNVKRLEFIARDDELVRYRIKPNLPRLGKRHGKLIPAIRAGLQEMDGAMIARAVAAGQTFSVQAGGQTLPFEPEDVLVETESAEGFASSEDEGFLVALDTTLTDALLIEGLARELVRTVQDARKQADLAISDRIVLNIRGSEKVEEALRMHKEFLMGETLAVKWAENNMGEPFTVQGSLGEEAWTIQLTRVSQ